MIVRPLTVVSSLPDASMLLGSNNRGNTEILDRINSRWSNSGVIFGSSNDPFKDRFLDFKRAFVNVARDTADLLNKTASFILDRDEIISINSYDDLAFVPACMQVPILTYEPIRKLFDKDLIYGWGLDKSILPKEDEYGRMINNGYIGPDPITGITPDEYEWHWKSTDPEYSIDELMDLAKAREFVDTFILSQTSEDGQLEDPTGVLDGLKIGDIR
jgi:hypothetical protein